MHSLERELSLLLINSGKYLGKIYFTTKILFLAFQEEVTGLRVVAMCNNSTVVACVNRQGGTVSHSLCSLASRLLRWSERLDLHLDTGYLPGQSYVGSGYRGNVVSPPTGGNCSAACMWLSVAGLVNDAPCREASPMLFPRPGSPGGLRMRFAFLGTTWTCTCFHPSSCQMGGGSSQRGPTLSLALVAPLWPEEEWFADLLLPLIVDFLVHLRRDKGLSVSTVKASRSALNSVFALMGLVLSPSREIFYVPQKFLEDRRA